MSKISIVENPCVSNFLALVQSLHYPQQRKQHIMGDHDITPTCLSAEEHGNNEARDVILHYLGCLEFCEREDYFSWLDEEHQKQVESELRRIEYLRNVLKRDKDEASLLSNLEKSMEDWRKCELFTCSDGINAVRTWRLAKGRSNSKNQRDPRTSHPASSLYDPDRDLNAHLVRYVKSQPEKEIKDPRFNGHFPNHKVPVSHLLDEKEPSNPLAKDLQPKESINYFHFPANNMQVSIALYTHTPFLDYGLFILVGNWLTNHSIVG
jgi:hypothetical protein